MLRRRLLPLLWWLLLWPWWLPYMEVVPLTQEPQSVWHEMCIYTCITYTTLHTAIIIILLSYMNSFDHPSHHSLVVIIIVWSNMFDHHPFPLFLAFFIGLSCLVGRTWEIIMKERRRRRNTAKIIFLYECVHWMDIAWKPAWPGTQHSWEIRPSALVKHLVKN